MPYKDKNSPAAKASRDKAAARFYAKNKEKHRKKQREWYAKNKEKARAQAKQRRAQHPERAAAIRWKSMFKPYGLTLQDYENMNAAQGGLCAICSRPETKKLAGKLLRLCVDHNHTTGKVRGLLCSRCNVAIGLLNDDLLMLQAATDYLRKWAI